MLGLLAIALLGAAGYGQRHFFGYNAYVNVGWFLLNSAVAAWVLWCLRTPWLVAIVGKFARRSS